MTKVQMKKGNLDDAGEVTRPLLVPGDWPTFLPGSFGSKLLKLSRETLMPGTARVGLARGTNRRGNIYSALDLVRDDIAPLVKNSVMLKPNFLSGTSLLASTHPDAIRGAIDFLLSLPNPPTEIVIAEGANEKEPGETFTNLGYRSLPDEYDVPIELLDLHQETRWETIPVSLDDGSEYIVHMPKTVLECPCTISVAVAKTHDVCVVTLALKNMIMGTIRKDDRVKMHGFPSHRERILPNEAQALNVNLTRLARFLTPHIGVIDGTVGLQGNGPGGSDAVPLGIAAASSDVFAVDSVVTKAMGFEPMEQGLSHYGDALGMGVADLDRINVVGARLEDVIVPFKPHSTTDDQLRWEVEGALERLGSERV